MNETIEVLCVTMHQTNFAKYEEMNLSTDAVFANQSDDTGYAETMIQGHRVKMITTATRGVGKNRNIALLYASGDILLFADDDIHYKDDYAQQVSLAYEKHPDADMIVFSLEYTKNGKIVRSQINRDGRIGLIGGLKNGTCVFSVRRKSLEKANIWFSTLFGGGARFAHGEDTLFFIAAKRNMRIYGSSYSLGCCSEDTSTWFSGYDAKYFFDQGVLYAAAFGWLALPMAVQFCIRKRKKFRHEMKLHHAIAQMWKGMTAYAR